MKIIQQYKFQVAPVTRSGKPEDEVIRRFYRQVLKNFGHREKDYKPAAD